ncbi:hypothetical protein [Streptomyces sp. NBC_01565]|uniref:hypothetical protein n=1 Tax=unclassified Streptomyces TaxID=2593676 RepID=UPI0022511DE5|nr:hypothetical protein [Streptomyces sp. NBC_01565]MCX4546982.1 hypothetical protein [Streptomyces sp. NBC_01565]
MPKLGLNVGPGDQEKLKAEQSVGGGHHHLSGDVSVAGAQAVEEGNISANAQSNTSSGTITQSSAANSVGNTLLNQVGRHTSVSAPASIAQTAAGNSVRAAGGYE